jgi:hypothetical protein
MQTSPAHRKRLTAAQREEILKAYQRSKLTQRAFAAQAGIGLSTLRLWLRKSATARAESGGFVELPNLLSQPPAGAVYRLHLKNGMVVEIGTGFQCEEVAALLQLLPA